jgi:D-alanyl-D-alanine carboxypeptidase
MNITIKNLDLRDNAYAYPADIVTYPGIHAQLTTKLNYLELSY